MLLVSTGYQPNVVHDDVVVVVVDDVVDVVVVVDDDDDDDVVVDDDDDIPTRPPPNLSYCEQLSPNTKFNASYEHEVQGGASLTLGFKHRPVSTNFDCEKGHNSAFSLKPCC